MRSQLAKSLRRLAKPYLKFLGGSSPPYSLAGVAMSSIEIEIQSAYWWVKFHKPNHLLTLVNRISGSKWGEGMSLEIFENLVVLEKWKKLITSQPFCIPKCSYYSLNSCDVSYQSVRHSKMQVSSLKDFKDLNSVFLRSGSHGLELVSHDVESSFAEEIWLIIGGAPDCPNPNQKMIWTCHPGKPFLSVKTAIATLESDHQEITVANLHKLATQNNLDLAVKKV